jgi:hypothetical protein
VVADAWGEVVVGAACAGDIPKVINESTTPAMTVPSLIRDGAVR